MPRLYWALSCLLLADCAGIGKHAVVPLPIGGSAAAAAPRVWKDWDEVFAAPTPLNVTAYVTGTVLVGPDILIDPANPRTPAEVKREQWVPALSYLVTHPRYGRFLMDAGLPRAPAEGKFEYGVPPFFKVECKAEAKQSVADQLVEEKITAQDIGFAVLSHLHGDHAGGLGDLAALGHLTVAVLPDEWGAAQRTFRMFDGYIAEQLNVNYDVAILPIDRAVDMPHVGKALDLFGDGSVWIIPTRGHTLGELSVLLNSTSGPRLFTFDAAHLRANLVNEVRPGFTADAEAATDSVRRLSEFAKAYPHVTVYFGHEPEQWKEVAGIRTQIVADLSGRSKAAP